MKKKFPLDQTTSAACWRAESILSLYKSAGSESSFDDLVAEAIADLAILSDVELGISHAEAIAEGDTYAHTGRTARAACEDGADLAEEILESEREAARRDDGGLYDSNIGVET